MDRKKFLLRSVMAGFVAPALFITRNLQGETFKQAVVDTADCDKKMTFTHDWVKRLMTVLDDKLTLPEREKIMQASGILCHRSQVKPNEQSPGLSIEKFIKKINSQRGEGAAQAEGNKIIIDLKTIKDGKASCLCPMVQDIDKGLSDTYCLCCTGFFKDRFEWNTNKPVTKVELINSARTNGKSCLFSIYM